MDTRTIAKMQDALEIALKALEGFERKDVAIEVVKAALVEAGRAK